MKKFFLGTFAFVLLSGCAKGDKMDIGTYIDSSTVEINHTISDPEIFNEVRELIEDAKTSDLTESPDGMPDKWVMIMDQDQGIVWVRADLWFVDGYTVIEKGGAGPSLVELSVEDTEILNNLLYQYD